ASRKNRRRGQGATAGRPRPADRDHPRSHAATARPNARDQPRPQGRPQAHADHIGRSQRACTVGLVSIMNWQLRHQGSPKSVQRASFEQIVDGLRDGVWETTDEVLGPGESAWVAIENHPQLAEIAEEVEAPPPRRHDEGTHLDMTALIDVCLVLLIFFILTTTYAAAVQKTVPITTAKEGKGKVRTVKLEEVTRNMIRVQASLDKAGKPVILVENQAVDVLGGDGDVIYVDKLRDALQPYVKGGDRKTEMLLDARE